MIADSSLKNSFDDPADQLKWKRQNSAYETKDAAKKTLLTRGRDGTVVFIPSDPYLEETATFLERCGFRPLESPGA